MREEHTTGGCRQKGRQLSESRCIEWKSILPASFPTKAPRMQTPLQKNPTYPEKGSIGTDIQVSPAEKRGHPTMKLTTPSSSHRCPTSILESTLKVQMDNSVISIQGRTAPVGNTVTKTSKKRNLGNKDNVGKRRKMPQTNQQTKTHCK